MVRVFAGCCCRFILVLALLGLVAAGADAATGGQLFAVQLVSHGADDTRLILGLVRPLAFRARIDAASGRLLVDFPDLAAIPGSSIGQGAGLVRTYHAEALAGGGVRLVFDLTHAATIAEARMLATERGQPPRAVIALKSASVAAMRAAFPPAAVGAAFPPAAVGAAFPPAAVGAAREAEASAAPTQAPSRQTNIRAAPDIAALIAPSLPAFAEPKPVTPVSRPAGGSTRDGVIFSSRRVIVIDPGHGGVDPGAPSIAGYHEKEVTLATARALRRVLENTGRYKVVMTRDSDVFLKLHERVAVARAAHGNLFVSLHADSVAGAGMQSASDRITRGASIYTLSETASDAESERYAQRENRADAIGGVALADQSDDVAGILVDLTVRETVNQGNRLAGMMAESLEHQGVALLPRAPHRAAGFAVLKSPDIPSILIEMGYLSDPSDARALADPRHQLQIAKAVAEGVDRYFAWLDSSRS